MSGSVNKVTLLGNVGKDPEIRKTQDGRSIANFSIATSESWKDRNTGEKKEKTEWSRVVVFNEGLTGVVEKYVRKGSKIYVEGSLQTRKWTDKDGVEKYSTEVVLQGFGSQLVLLGDPKGGRATDDDGYAPPADDRITSGKQAPRSSMKHSDMDDEIPFLPEFR
jgi:single-strand DNA-binding protein